MAGAPGAPGAGAHGRWPGPHAPRTPPKRWPRRRRSHFVLRGTMGLLLALHVNSHRGCGCGVLELGPPWVQELLPPQAAKRAPRDGESSETQIMG